jgi:T4 RnlA family RNA ligase
MKILNYIEFIKENKTFSYIPDYNQAVELCNIDKSPFYEVKNIVDGYNISVFNYRLAKSSDFSNPIPNKPEIKGYEMRGLTFVFNNDGSIYKRYILLEKFFNINEAPETLYSVVKNYKIKFINNKEDGSIATFIKLPNGKIVGKSKLGFDNDQANSINEIYHNNDEINRFVNWCLDRDIVPIFEYVSPSNKIVLRYEKSELILLRLRDNKTGKHLNIKDYLDVIGSIRIAPFNDDISLLDDLIELTATEVDKEGYVVTAEDKHGNDFFFKIKTPWYINLHKINDYINNENIIIEYILDDKIDDILGQIPEKEKETRERIFKIISIIKNEISNKISSIEKDYDYFVKSSMSKKEYAINNRINNPNFNFVMNLIKLNELKNMTKEEIEKRYTDINIYYKELQKRDIYEVVKKWIKDKTNHLKIAREWLRKKDPSLFL